ncbi:MAG: hypothetical protein UU18_C0009G0036 [Parcubacteria group bacterium GW2011_GWB2_40_8]|nr:MAG: hypothetical protein UT71_C0005G0049 [Parcubacteria group bacterium GW2011_GWF2_40_10]KKR59773.1 MAG: hypothetical protein UT97_C0011G0017 [Parcubacteria group bacterium GW2011_GWC2_40_31]KKR75295.1 MAG: hypothetical protein UU18_C0009G0036 [Parcubacteria group bacterium GW2011_GWB2_40_8]KKR76480.1 MAG: hypothetical protein UU20_C0024G0002 [Parcubacteria group bacterium GW2011_GWE2_40_8]KKR82550.1 MAG: hypothetical protein UU28_C0008G0020 [Parcubacteria group bacterium GW2011_GWD2_40_9]
MNQTMTLAEALKGKEIPKKIKDSLEIIDVPYFSFGGENCIGQLVTHKNLTDETKDIFKKLFIAKFPIAKIIPICEYDWSDDKSMKDNNTSAFNYRKIYGTERLSSHSYGSAIDINPIQNPYIAKDGSIHPALSSYDHTTAGTITSDGIVVKIFKEAGWHWGGEWQTVKDYQHFEKSGFTSS